MVEQVIRRIRTNREWRELYGDLNIKQILKTKRLEWIGHVVGVDHGRVVKSMFESKPGGKRE